MDNDTIDRVNIYEATKLGMLQAIEQMKGEVTKPDYLLIDAMQLDTPIPQLSLIKGDANSFLLQQLRLWQRLRVIV